VRGFVDFVLFRRLIFNLFVIVAFWIGVIVIIWRGIRLGNELDINGVVVFILVILSIFVWRLFCEILIVIFRINDTLTIIKNNTLLLKGIEPELYPTLMPQPAGPAGVVSASSGEGAKTSASAADEATEPSATPPREPPAPAAQARPTERAAEREAEAKPSLRYCTNCGAANAASNRFCERCGRRLGNEG